MRHDSHMLYVQCEGSDLSVSFDLGLADNLLILDGCFSPICDRNYLILEFKVSL